MAKGISEKNFLRIQRVAIPLIDTLDSALERILDVYEQTMKNQAKETESEPQTLHTPATQSSIIERVFDPIRPPDLTHTKVTLAIFGSHTLKTPTWNALLDEAIRSAARDLASFAEIKKLVPANLVEGQKIDQGYRYLVDAGVSVQGQSANDAWRSVTRIARHLGYPVYAYFFWYGKEAAAYPGVAGSLRIEGIR